jgi:hypothetical protein
VFDLLSFSNRSDIKAWALKHPVLARLACLLILLMFPLLVPGVILMDGVKRLGNLLAEVWRERGEVWSLFTELFALALLPWEDK